MSCRAGIFPFPPDGPSSERNPKRQPNTNHRNKRTDRDRDYDKCLELRPAGSTPEIVIVFDRPDKWLNEPHACPRFATKLNTLVSIENIRQIPSPDRLMDSGKAAPQIKNTFIRFSVIPAKQKGSKPSCQNSAEKTHNMTYTANASEKHFSNHKNRCLFSE